MLMARDDQSGEDVGLRHHKAAYEAGKRDRVPEHEAQDRALVSEPVGGRRGDDDRLRVDPIER